MEKNKRQSKPNDQEKRQSKKDQILALFLTGITAVDEIARMTESRPSYVASVLQRAGLMSDYFDLYTSTGHPINVYSRIFAGKLGFKNEEVARASVKLIDQVYKRFERAKDRAGQHHALMMALTMFNRARWTNKIPEAEIFRHWIIQLLEEELDEKDSSLEENF